MKEFVVVNTMNCSIEFDSDSFEECEKYIDSCDEERNVFGELTIATYNEYIEKMK